MLVKLYEWINVWSASVCIIVRIREPLFFPLTLTESPEPRFFVLMLDYLEQNVIYNVIYSNWQSLIKEENPYVIAYKHKLRFFPQKSSILSQEVAINSMLDQIEELKKIQNPEIIDDIHLQYLRLISVLFLPALKNGAAFGDKKPCKNHWNWNRSLSNSALVTRCWQ